MTDQHFENCFEGEKHLIKEFHASDLNILGHLGVIYGKIYMTIPTTRDLSVIV